MKAQKYGIQISQVIPMVHIGERESPRTLHKAPLEAHPHRSSHTRSFDSSYEAHVAWASALQLQRG